MAIRVVVAEMDAEQRMEITTCIRQTKGLEVAGEAGDGAEALEVIRRIKPQVLLCGMLMPRMDGCALLEEITRLQPENRPAVIILSSISRDDIVRRAFELGAADYLIKPYDPAVLIRRIMSAAGQAGKRYMEQDRRMEQRLSGILLELGIPAHVQGFRFLQEAIRATIADPPLTCHMMHELYPHVARKCRSTPERVERSIRDAIQQAWLRCKPEDMRRILSRSLSGGYEKPTSGELIALLAEQLRLGL